MTRLALSLAFVVRAVLPSGGHFPFSFSLPLPTKGKSLLFVVTFDCPMQFLGDFPWKKNFPSAEISCGCGRCGGSGHRPTVKVTKSESHSSFFLDEYWFTTRCSRGLPDKERVKGCSVTHTRKAINKWMGSAAFFSCLSFESADGRHFGSCWGSRHFHVSAKSQKMKDFVSADTTFHFLINKEASWADPLTAECSARYTHIATSAVHSCPLSPFL